MISLFDLFRDAGKPIPRLVAVHDYTDQWDGHRIVRAATGDTAFVTGESMRDGDVLVLPDGRYRLSGVLGCDYSDLYIVTLEPES